MTTKIVSWPASRPACEIVAGRAVFGGVGAARDQDHSRTDHGQADDPASQEGETVDRARGVANISTTPTIGIGLSAIATANGSDWPIAWPITG